MSVPKSLTDRVDDALRALEAIQKDAAAIDKRAQVAERRAAKAVEEAEQAREAKERAEARLSEAEQKIIDTRAGVAGRIATLESEVEMLAKRDREARDELERLRMTASKDKKRPRVA